MADWTGSTDVVVDFDPLDFAADNEPTEVVTYFRVRQIVGGVETRDATFVYEHEAHDLADVWRGQRHTLPWQVDIHRVRGGTETIVARYKSDEPT